MTQTQSLRERLWHEWVLQAKPKADVWIDAMEAIVRSERAAAWRECREAAAKLMETWRETPDGRTPELLKMFMHKIRSLEPPDE